MTILHVPGADMPPDSGDLTAKLTTLLNGYENPSNTPDFILAEYLKNCLDAYNNAVQDRAAWYNRMDIPGRGHIPYPPTGETP
jgi:hypothetical protein